MLDKAEEFDWDRTNSAYLTLSLHEQRARLVPHGRYQNKGTFPNFESGARYSTLFVNPFRRYSTLRKFIRTVITRKQYYEFILRSARPCELQLSIVVWCHSNLYCALGEVLDIQCYLRRMSFYENVIIWTKVNISRKAKPQICKKAWHPKRDAGFEIAAFLGPNRYVDLRLRYVKWDVFCKNHGLGVKKNDLQSWHDGIFQAEHCYTMQQIEFRYLASLRSYVHVIIEVSPLNNGWSKLWSLNTISSMLPFSP